MYVTGAKIQLFSDLVVGNVESHEVQAGNPHLKGLMVTCENGVSQVIKITAATLALIVLAIGLHRIMAVLLDMFRTTVRTMHLPVRPAVLTDHFEASCVADQFRNFAQIHCEIDHSGDLGTVSFSSPEPDKSLRSLVPLHIMDF